MVEEVVKELPEAVLPEITILVPTWNRTKFFKLFVMNLMCQDYPHHLLKVIIDDDGDERFITNEETLTDFKKYISPMEITYITNKPRRSIGKKRDDLIKECKTKIFVFMDDDDIYLPTYISHTYNTMKEKKAGCAGCDKMLFCMTQRNFDIHAINCGNQVKLIHEATLMMTKKWYRASCKFADSSQGEGKNIFEGYNEKSIAITDITQIMCCVQHDGNTVEKLQFAREDNKIDLNLSDELISILKEILEIKE
jgi:hypothetical protein